MYLILLKTQYMMRYFGVSGNQVATGHHGGSLRCPPATLCTTPQQDGRELFGMPAHRNNMISYTLKDTFVRLDLTLTDATVPPLLLEIRRVSLLLLCFHGCFNALRLSVMSS